MRRGCVRVSLSESPPNFSSTAFASSNATTASPTTPPAGTAQTSVRCLIAAPPVPVARSTVASGRGTVENGFIARAQPDRLAGRHPALDPAGTRRLPADPPAA